MTRKSKLDLNACACTARVLVWIGRYLLILSALSLLTMPITEHWDWDHFVQTGRDFEIGTLMLLTFFCLVLVLSKQLKQGIESFLSFLSLCSSLASQFTDGIAPAILLSVKPTISNPDPATGAGTLAGGFPLQI